MVVRVSGDRFLFSTEGAGGEGGFRQDSLDEEELRIEGTVIGA